MGDAILVVDDHPLFREGLGQVLVQLFPAVELLGADDAPAGLTIAEAMPSLRLVLIDRKLPRMSGLTAIPLFLQLRPEVPVVMISADEQAADVRAALAAGAQGFIPKSAKAAEILHALRLVLNGSRYVPPLLVDAMPPSSSEGAPSAVDEHGLTQRQRQVLVKLCEGLSNKEIGRELGLAENTVKVHISAIFKALGTMSRTQAMRVARERGIS